MLERQKYKISKGTYLSAAGKSTGQVVFHLVGVPILNTGRNRRIITLADQSVSDIRSHLIVSLEKQGFSRSQTGTSKSSYLNMVRNVTFLGGETMDWEPFKRMTGRELKGTVSYSN